MTAQGHDVTRMLLDMRATKERAEARVAELEAQIKGRSPVSTRSDG